VILRTLPLRFFTRSGARGGPARPTKRAGRGALLWFAAAILLIHVALAVAVETAFPQIRDPEYGHLQSHAAEQQRAFPDRQLVLVIGTSRTQNAIDPAALGFPDAPGAPLAINAGQPGSWPVHLRLTYHRLRDAGARPAAVLIELFPPTLGFAGPADLLFRTRTARLSAADLRRLEPYLDDPAPLVGSWALNRANSLHALGPVIMSYLGPRWQTQELSYQRRAMEQFGFTPYPHDALPDALRGPRRAETERSFGGAVHELTVSALSDRAYRDLVADCRATGVPVAFFLAPESPVFRSWYTPQSRVVLSAYTRVLSDELGCPVFDAPTDFTEEDFADGHHMLPPAARRFSRWLAERHLNLWLTSVRSPIPPPPTHP